MRKNKPTKLDGPAMLNSLGLRTGGTFTGRLLSDKSDTIVGTLVLVVFDAQLHPVVIRLRMSDGQTFRVPWTAIRSYRCGP